VSGRGKPRFASTVDDSGYIPVVFPESSQTQPLGRWLWRWDARTGKRVSSIRCAISRAIWTLWFQLLWGPLAREIVRECCSLPRRIATIYATRVYSHGVCFGRPGSRQEPSANERTLACIQDTRRITSSYRWATTLDVKLVVEAWQMGAEWACASECTSQKHNTNTAKESLMHSQAGCANDTPVLRAQRS
jgi:hypothetical protein